MGRPRQHQGVGADYEAAVSVANRERRGGIPLLQPGVTDGLHVKEMTDPPQRQCEPSLKIQPAIARRRFSNRKCFGDPQNRLNGPGCISFQPVVDVEIASSSGNWLQAEDAPQGQEIFVIRTRFSGRKEPEKSEFPSFSHQSPSPTGC